MKQNLARRASVLAVACALTAAGVVQSSAAHAAHHRAPVHHRAIVVDGWVSWQHGFARVMHGCASKAEANCLAKAFNTVSRPALSASGRVVDDLDRDLRTGEILLDDHDGSDALWKEFGIDSKSYLGTGYSVPQTGASLDYDRARQREYFVPNFCAEAVDPKPCQSVRPGLWTLRLSDDQARAWLDKPVGELLKAMLPHDAAGSYEHSGPASGGLPSALIRVSRFDSKFYSGTIGRPGAQRVFFADLDQVRDTSLRDEMIATGSPALADKPDPGKTLFVWVLVPSAETDVRIASWKSLFDILAATH
jgi:hypothetical protein